MHLQRDVLVRPIGTEVKLDRLEAATRRFRSFIQDLALGRDSIKPMGRRGLGPDCMKERVFIVARVRVCFACRFPLLYKRR